MILGIALALGVIYFITTTAGGSEVVTGYDELYKKWGRIYGVDWKMLKAISQIESREGLEPSVKRGLENPNDIEGSKSSDGLSWGLMQVQVPTAQDYDVTATAVKLNNPDYSVKIAAQHLKRLETVFNKSDVKFREWVIKSYNQGEGTMYKVSKGQLADTAKSNAYWTRYKNAYNSISGI